MDDRLVRFTATWNSHNVDAIVDLFAADALIEDDFVIVDPSQPPGRRTYRGRDEIRGCAPTPTGCAARACRPLSSTTA
jgi:hypothetical protein